MKNKNSYRSCMEQFQLAISSKKVAQLNNKTLYEFLNVEVEKLLTAAGHSVELDKIKTISEGFTKNLKNKYSYLGIEEIKLMLKNGLAGDYGVPKYFSLITLNAWIKLYLKQKNDTLASQQKEVDQNQFNKSIHNYDPDSKYFAQALSQRLKDKSKRKISLSEHVELLKSNEQERKTK